MSAFDRKPEDRAPKPRGVPFDALTPKQRARIAGYEARKAGIRDGRIPEEYKSEELSREFVAGMNDWLQEQNPLTPEEIAARARAGGLSSGATEEE